MRIGLSIAAAALMILATAPACYADTSCKPYMDYRSITDKTSKQYQLVSEMSADETGVLVNDSGDYAVAMGSAWGAVGDRFTVTLDDGKTFTVIMADMKQDRHTDKTHRFDAYGGIIEFIIDRQSEAAKQNVWSNGYVWQGNFNNNPLFSGEITSVERIDEEK